MPTDFAAIYELISNLVNGGGFVSYFLLVFLLGEYATITIFSSYFEFGGNLQINFAAAMVGVLAADFFWFAVGRYFPVSILPKSLTIKKITLPEFIDLEKNDKKLLFVLSILKFLIGIRILVMIYIARKKISWMKLIILDSIIVFFYVGFLYFLSFYTHGIMGEVVSRYRLFSTILTCFAVIYVLYRLILYLNRRKFR